MTAPAARLVGYDNIRDVPHNIRYGIATLAVHMVRDGHWTKLYAANALHDLGMCASPEKVGAAAGLSGPASWWLINRLSRPRWGALEADCPKHGAVAS